MKYLFILILLCLFTCGAGDGQDTPLATGIVAEWEPPENDRRKYNNNSRHARIEVGRKDGKETLDFIKWPGLDDSVYFNIDLGLNPDRIEFVGDTTLIDYPSFDLRFYTIDESTLEWEAILYSKPAQPSFSFDFEYSNLEFLYQDSVDAEPGTFYFAHGSYAVYHSYKGGKFITEADSIFKVGKAFHIDRPKAWDSAGDTVWLDIEIDTLSNELTISGERSWFRDATYPVTIDPTFGYESQGASGTGLAWATVCLDDFYTASSGDIITSFSFYGNSGTAEAAAYENDGGTCDGSPRLGAVTSWSPSVSAEWQTSSTISREMSNGVSYSPAIGEVVDGVAIFYDSGAGVNNEKAAGVRLPAEWEIDTESGAHYSIYATYTEGGAAEANPTQRRREERRR